MERRIRNKIETENQKIRAGGRSIANSVKKTNKDSSFSIKEIMGELNFNRKAKYLWLLIKLKRKRDGDRRLNIMIKWSYSPGREEI